MRPAHFVGGLAAAPRRTRAKTAARGVAVVRVSATAVPCTRAIGRRPRVLLEQVPAKGGARCAGHRPGAVLLMANATLARPPLR